MLHPLERSELQAVIENEGLEYGLLHYASWEEIEDPFFKKCLYTLSRKYTEMEEKLENLDEDSVFYYKVEEEGLLYACEHYSSGESEEIQQLAKEIVEGFEEIENYIFEETVEDEE